MGTLKVTDMMFAKAIADLSANNTLYFTPKQLLYLLDKRLQAKSASSPIKSLGNCIALSIFTFFIFVSPGLAKGNLSLLFIPVAINLIFLCVLWFQSVDKSASVKARRVAAQCLRFQGAFVFIFGIILSLNTQLFSLFAFAVLFGILSFYLGTWQHKVQKNTTQTLLLEVGKFQEWLAAWQRINPIAKLLPIPNETSLPMTMNPDVTAYSFDRLVVTDSAAIAQFLIANNFHFENNCAILSITGYPQGIFDTTMAMLQRNPDLKVYAFHDCSATGVNLVHQLRTSPQWFQNSSVEIFDVGLLPRQVIAMPTLLVQRSSKFADMAKQLAVPVRQQFTADELAWLDDGNAVLLESLPPQRLIQALHRGIAASHRILEENSLSDSDLIFVEDNSGSYYFVESFG